MKSFQHYLLAAAGLAILGLVAAIYQSEPARALNPENPKPVEIVEPIPLPTLLPTHQGVPAGDFVLLSAARSSSVLSRRFADGTRNFDEFVVPNGKFFVATDFDFSSSGATPGAMVQYTVSYGGSPFDPSFSNVGHVSGAIAGVSGRCTRSVSGTTGFVAGPLTKIRGEISGAGSPFHHAMIVRGYLVDGPQILPPILPPGDGPPPR